MRTTEGQPELGRCLGDKAREIEVSWCRDNRGGCSGEGFDRGRRVAVASPEGKS